MSYAPIYQCTFDSISSQPYRILISKKDYSGNVFNIIGSGVPVVHAWDSDDPKAPIKGSSLTVKIINPGWLPIESFYSNEDDTFKVEFFWNTQLLFSGFLVQDDHIEEMVEFTHELTLSANDNLGLLKSVTIDKAEVNVVITTGVVILGGNAPNELLIPTSLASSIVAGNKIRVQGTGTDGLFTAVSFVVTPITTAVYILENAVNSGIWPNAQLTIYGSAINFQAPVSLLAIIQACLYSTNVLLPVTVYANLIETTQDPANSFLAQTLVAPESLLTNDTDYEDCYTILENICNRFNITVFQANGIWNLVRWDDLRYYINQIHGYSFDQDFTFLGDVYMPAPFNAGISLPMIAETGLMNRIERPLKYAQETFNYKQPGLLLKNYNLKTLGSLIRQYTTGSGITLQTIYEYNMPFWVSDPLSIVGSSVFFIRVITDNFGNELERYAVVENADIMSTKIEANTGDTFKFSFSFKTSDSQPGNVGVVFKVRLTDGTLTRYAREPGNIFIEPGWGGGPGYRYNISVGDNSDQWHSVEVIGEAIPFDGVLYCYLSKLDLSGTDNGTFYKDIRFEYTPMVNSSTKIIGQRHTNEHTPNIKQNLQEEIFFDSSPRNSISGTLFLNQLTGLLQKRTDRWKRIPVTESLRLGEITTFETLFARRIPRTIIEGSFKGLVQSGIHLSLLSVIKYSGKPTLNFVFGKLEIDYRNDKVNGSTLYENHNDTEADGDINHIYTFEYLYSTT